MFGCLIDNTYSDKKLLLQIKLIYANEFYSKHLFSYEYSLYTTFIWIDLLLI
jgi:hypothetical protein